MDIDLSKKVAIVTGAGQGIGRAIAITLAQHGARVAVADLNVDAATGVAKEIVDMGGEGMAVQLDVRDSASVQAAVDRCMAKWQTVDILVNNAGIATTQMVEDMPEADWRRVVDVNLTGPFLTCKAVLPEMRKKGRGKIVNVLSTAAKRISYNSGANYTASKEGLFGFTRHFAYEVAPYGINVNAICPGPTLTPLLKSVATKETLRAREKSVPQGRMASPEDHAKAVLFLVSDLADHICGVALDVDGGSLLGWYDIDIYQARRRQPQKGKEG